MSAHEVREITAAETIELRWRVLRPGFLRETAIFPGDDAAMTRHFGAFVDGALVGVASIFAAAPPDEPDRLLAWQLRGMATAEHVRGEGIGLALLRACESAAREEGAAVLWCNARTTAAAFYERHGWRIISAEFDIPTVGPHVRMIQRTP